MIKAASFSTQRDSPAPSLSGVFHYSLFRAADEKIPLSVVRVNNKPQHLVFCWCFAHLLPKQRHLPVESRKWPCLARGCAVCFAPKLGPTLRRTQGGSRFPYHDSTVALRELPHKAQNWCRFVIFLCEMWTMGDRNRRCLCPKLQIVMRRVASVGAGRGQSRFHLPVCDRTRHAFRARIYAGPC